MTRKFRLMLLEVIADVLGLLWIVVMMLAAIAGLLFVCGLLGGCALREYSYVETDPKTGVRRELRAKVPATDTKAGKLIFTMTEDGPQLTVDNLSLDERAMDAVAEVAGLARTALEAAK